MNTSSSQLSEIINVRLPSDLTDALRRAAANDGRTLSAFIRHRMGLIIQYERNDVLAELEEIAE